MFSSLGKFSRQSCPEQAQCSALNCVFDHKEVSSTAQSYQSPLLDTYDQSAAESTGPSPKRRKVDSSLTQENLASVQKSSNLPDVIRLPVSINQRASHAPPSKSANNALGFVPKIVKNERPELSTTTTTTISPPPLRRKQLEAPPNQVKAKAAISPQVNATLNPRKVQHDPAGHQNRTVYLRMLHQAMASLNDNVKASEDPAMMSLVKSGSEMIIMALDEEEKIVQESPIVYSNVIKQRIMYYKKMKLDQWQAARLQEKAISLTTVEDHVKLKKDGEKIHQLLNTGLMKEQEVLVLQHLFADQKPLAKFGYVISPPTEAEIQAAKGGMIAAQNWEICERCKSRFQVFPDRREDGALTSGGKCIHHHGRMVFPERRPGDVNKGQKDQTWSCCGQSVGASGSIGCTIGETHVFKVSDGKRLASILQFERTPENPRMVNKTAVTFDCEMCYTVLGLELVRLTAVSWPDGEQLLDVFVRPLGTILDLNTRFSGVSPEHLLNAIPYPDAKSKSTSNGTTLNGKQLTNAPSNNGQTVPYIVESPMAARTLLFALLSPSTPLIGHSIENDLNVVRIVHPTIVDTVLLFPTKRGLPYRRALKSLAAEYLSRDIQMGGATGHDSKEDAIATGDLVRVKVARKWKDMQAQGWMMQNNQLVGPASVKK